MMSQPMTQIVVETPAGFVFLVREVERRRAESCATGKKGAVSGLALYDLKTCIRDAREGMAGGAAERRPRGRMRR